MSGKPSRPPRFRRDGSRRADTCADFEDTTVDEYRIPAAGDAFASLPGGDEVDEAPDVCNDGWITIGQMAVDPETGEETEGFAMYFC